VGGPGNDTLAGKGGLDRLFGGSGQDTLTGGDGDDQAFGEDGNDRMIWSPGDDSDVNEGGAGVDVSEVNGGNGSESFTETANGARVRFDRIDPAPFSIDIATVETLSLNTNGGDDHFAGTGNLAPLISTVVDGGEGSDSLLGTNGADRLIGGNGNDFIDGNQGNDTADLGAGDDVFQWDPGDGSDTVEGRDGADSLQFNGANNNEQLAVQADGPRAKIVRDVGSVTVDTAGLEAIAVHARGGTDELRVQDLSATEVTSVQADLSDAATGADDLAADRVVVTGTNDADTVIAGGQNSDTEVLGLAATVSINGAGTNDTVSIATFDGDDVVDASGVANGSASIAIDGGAGDDVLIGGSGDDTISGGEGDDVLIGGPGFDTLDGGTGDNVLIDGEQLTAGVVQGQAWLTTHTQVANGKSTLKVNGKSYVAPAADLVS